MCVDEAYLKRFPQQKIDDLRALARRSKAHAELAHTHPLAFIALARTQIGSATATAAEEALSRGLRLGRVCAALDVPYCLRTAPPEACRVPSVAVSWSGPAARRLAGCRPSSRPTYSNWLPAIYFAHVMAGERFAAWLAGQRPLFEAEVLDEKSLLPLALYAWHSQRPDCDHFEFGPERWSDKFGLVRALNGTRSWLNRVTCRCYLPTVAPVSAAHAEIALGRYHVVALADYRSLLDEHVMMQNCLDRYARRIASGDYQIFSLRTAEGARVADFEAMRSDKDSFVMHEIKGPGNSPVSPLIQSLAAGWLGRQPQQPRMQKPTGREADARLRLLLSNYAEQHAAALSEAGPLSLQRLEGDLITLALRAGITSWPFRGLGFH